MARTVARSWVMNMYARLRSCCRWSSSRRIPSATSWSRAEVTSSQMMNDGSAASARAMQMRCFWPPDSSPGRRVEKQVGIEFDHLHQLPQAPFLRIARHAEIERQRTADDIADAVPGIHRGIRHLVDHLRLAQLVLGAAMVVPGQFLAVEINPALLGAGRQARDHPGCGALAAAGLPHHCHRVAPVNLEVHAAQHRDQTAGIGGRYVFDLHERRRLRRRRHLLLAERAHRPERLGIVLLRVRQHRTGIRIFSTVSPYRSTLIRSAICATTARSWVM